MIGEPHYKLHRSLQAGQPAAMSYTSSPTDTGKKTRKWTNWPRPLNHTKMLPTLSHAGPGRQVVRLLVPCLTTGAPTCDKRTDSHKLSCAFYVTYGVDAKSPPSHAIISSTLKRKTQRQTCLSEAAKCGSTPAVPALRRFKQKDCKLEASPSYTPCSRKHKPGRHHAAGSLDISCSAFPYLASHSNEEVHHGVRVLLVNGLGKKRVSSWQ